VSQFEKCNDAAGEPILDRSWCERLWNGKPDTFNIIAANEYKENE
jgi:hypothetical protein